MAWVTKDSTETYNQTPEPPREYTKAEKAANWWHYHWAGRGRSVVAGRRVRRVGSSRTRSFRPAPTCRSLMSAPSDLPTDTVTALQDALTPFCHDENGDGKVVVQVATATMSILTPRTKAPMPTTRWPASPG